LTSEAISTAIVSTGIMVVEDALVRGFLRAVLQLHGHHAICLEASEGVRLLASGVSGVALLITNVPDRFAEFAGQVPVLYLSSCPDPALVAGFRANRVLSKPFRTVQFLSCVEQLLHPI